MNIKLLKAQSILQEALQEALFDLEDTRLKNIAVTRVECTRGREMAKVFLDENSLGDMTANDALKLLKKASGAIRANLQAQLSWYKTPNLVFEIDRTLNEINKLESIFKKIHSKEKNSSLGEGNSPLELHSADFGIFGASQTPSLVSAPKIPKNYESQTENPSVVDSTQSVESNKKIKSKKPIKSFCYFWLLPKVESPLPLNPNLPKSALSPQDEFATRISND